LQARVGPLEAGDFVPEPDELFEGGDVGELVQYCRQNNLSLRYGSRAQLIVAELTRDLVREADERIAALSERIEHYKAQNVAHTDLIGKLLVCAAHCHGCHDCCHHGYGYCGHAPVMPSPPIAGLNSHAYDTREIPRYLGLKSSERAETDASRLKFLIIDEPARGTRLADEIVQTNDGKRAAAGTHRF
jgi:hypothetical protein